MIETRIEEVTIIDVIDLDDNLPTAEMSGMTREQQIIALASQGKTDKEIATFLGIKPSSVATYWVRVRNRYGAASRTEAIASVLNEAARNLRLVIELNPDAIVVSSDGMAIYGNPAAAQLLGCADASELIGYKTLDLIDEVDHPIVFERARNVAAGLRNPVAVFHATGLDGRKLVIESSSGPATWDGKPAMISTVRDRTREFEAERELKRKVEVLEALVDGLPDLMFVMTPDGYYLDMRECLETRAVAPREELLGRHYREFLPPDVSDKLDEAFSTLLSKGAVSSLRYNIETDGTTEHFEAKLARTTDGNVLVVVRVIA
ncbi:MAG: PAS domain S-box protein [Fimbriimonadaceae bacterium]